MRINDTTKRRIAERVIAHAEEHYAEGGWDFVVECWDADQIMRLAWMEPSEPLTFEHALATIKELVGILDERRQDAVNSAF